MTHWSLARTSSSSSQASGTDTCASTVVGAQGRQDDLFSEGYADYRSGDYAGALDRWRDLAEAGHPKAQYGLGLMYANAQGVAKDMRSPASCCAGPPSSHTPVPNSTWA